MYKEERQNQIRTLLKENRRVEVSTLTNLMGVSDATIRSDLEELEKTGFLKRFHGGAALCETESRTEAGFTEVAPSADKEAIGVIAARLIEDREGIFLGPGTTNYYIAKALRSRQSGYVNVVTNNFLVAKALYGSTCTRIHFLGGMISPDGLFTIPDNMAQDLDRIFLDKMFFSIDGIDPDAGYTLSDPIVQGQILMAAARSRTVIMAADKSKFGNRSFMTIGGLDFAPIVITNGDIPDKYKDIYKSLNIKTCFT